MGQKYKPNLFLAWLSLLGAVVIPVILGLCITHPALVNSYFIRMAIEIAALFSVLGIVLQFRSLLELHKQSTVDMLTGLLNRDSFFARLKKEITKTKNEPTMFHVLLININKFKQINNTIGHHAGNQLLLSVANKLRESVGSSDVVARLGGDEFAVILLDPSKANTYKQAVHKMVKLINVTSSIGGSTTYNSVNIGVVTCTNNDLSATIVLRRAAVALHLARKAKQDFYVFKSEDDATTVEDITYLGEIQSAITSEELELWFQPKLSLHDGSVSSAECLVRWKHPSKGIIYPDAFIPIAESTGLIKSLTRSVITQAVRAYTAILQSGQNISLSINISPVDIIDPTIVTSIVSGIIQHSMPPEKMILEVTETTFMHNSEDAGKVLISLESIGIKLSIDDFGTGYSSLLYLKNFPINEIKLDRTFVTDILSNVVGRNIVKSTINLAHELNAIVVAEGVETLEIRDLLQSLGCDYIQGYLVAKPMPLSEFLEWLNRHNHRLAISRETQRIQQ